MEYPRFQAMDLSDGNCRLVGIYSDGREALDALEGADAGIVITLGPPARLVLEPEPWWRTKKRKEAYARKLRRDALARSGGI